MAKSDKTDEKGMTGASAQRWEPADEGVVLEAPNQPPPGGGANKREEKDETRPTTSNPLRPGEKSSDA
jgi:hypothetical protein